MRPTASGASFCMSSSFGDATPESSIADVSRAARNAWRCGTFFNEPPSERDTETETERDRERQKQRDRQRDRQRDSGCPTAPATGDIVFAVQTLYDDCGRLKVLRSNRCDVGIGNGCEQESKIGVQLRLNLKSRFPGSLHFTHLSTNNV